MNFKTIIKLNFRLLALVLFIFISNEAWSQCCCRPAKPKLCFTGTTGISDCDIGNDCSDITLTENFCGSSTPGNPFAIVVTPSDTLTAVGSYPENLCGLFEQALPGRWTIERLSDGSYQFSYVGDSVINLISFGDNIISGPTIQMSECN